MNYSHESDFWPVYRHFREHCRMGRWRAFWKAVDCWSIF